jgi:tRNA-modifying protein YgfZ
MIGDMGAWTHRHVDGGSLLRLPDVEGVPRCIVASSTPLENATAQVLDDAAWRALEVRSGIPLIEAATVDQFVPQMLNYELVGGVDFRKGCYPGQEVVARSQYRGTIKRRMFLFESASAPLFPAQEIFHSADATQPAGMVVNAAGTLALIEVKLAALDSGSLHAGSVDGPTLTRRELPYIVPSDAALPV